jgi:hypothetical protein
MNTYDIKCVSISNAMAFLDDIEDYAKKEYEYAKSKNIDSMYYQKKLVVFRMLYTIREYLETVAIHEILFDGINQFRKKKPQEKGFLIIYYPIGTRNESCGLLDFRHKNFNINKI